MLLLLMLNARQLFRSWANHDARKIATITMRSEFE
jgi:hypothetical protein